MRSAILCSIACFFILAAAPFAQAANTVFLRAEVQSPVWHEDDLRISLTPDEKACQAAYGDDWKQICQYWGAFGASPRGVKLSPLQPGQWSRTDDGDLLFRPQGAWLTDTAFSVDLKDVQLAGHRKISNPVVGFKTLPLAAEVPPGKLWIDPDSKGEHALSFDLRFTTPPDRATVEKSLQLKTTAGARLSAPSFIWTEKDTRLLVKSRILALPSAQGEARLTLPQVRALAKQNGRWQLLKGMAGQSLVLPGASEIFRITQMRVEPWQNAALETEYHLVLRSSLRVTPEDMLPQLTVVELPRQRSEENLRPIVWSSTMPMAKDIAAGRRLKPRPFRVEGESADIVRFVLPVTPGSYVYCQVAAGFGPSPHYKLIRPAAITAHAARPESTVAFLQPGNVLVLPPKSAAEPKPNAAPPSKMKEAQLSLMSRDVDSLHWRIQRISTARPDALRPWHKVFSPNYFDEALESAGPAVEGVLTPTMEKSGLGFSTLNLAPVLQKLGGCGLFHVEVQGFAKGKHKATAAKILLLTDMGMVAKKTPDGRRHIFVCSLETGQPMAGARVRALGKNGLPVAQVVTDAEGKATLPALDGLTREKSPVAITAEYGEENQSGVGLSLSWMRLDDPETQVDYSRFPTKGQLSAGGGLNAYVFAQRGIFRPGEKLHFGVMVRRGDWKPLPEQFPLVATLRDPAGRVLLRRPFNAASGLTEQAFTVPEAAPTGLYRLGISTPPASESLEEEGDLLGSGAARVEEFEPDTLEIQTTVAPTATASATVAAEAGASALPAGWLRPGADGGQLRVSLRNLYGLPAAGRRIKAEMRVQAAPLHFPGYADFTFPDILPWQGEGLTLNLPETQTDEAGGSTVPLGLDRLRQGTLRCSVLVEGFELGGGRGVSTTKEFLVSPLPYMVGYRLQGAVTNLNFVPKGVQGGLEFLAVNEALQEHNPGPLTFELARRRYVTALTTDSSGQYAFEESPVDTRLASSVLSMDAKGRLVWPLPSKDPGQYLLTVRTADSTILARLPFTVAGDDDMRPGLVQEDKLPGTQLRMTLNKENYAPGETAQVYLASPYEGVGLITLERDSVAAHKWFRLSPGNNVLSFPIPADFEGRGYLNVSLARHASSPDIFVQPYSFALAPLTVNAAGRDMGLALAVPALAQPGQNMQVRLATGTEGKVIVFAVDEGVLQLTRFTTPDPLRYLLLDRALEVQTFQWLDSIMPGHAQLEARLRKARAAFGGGMDLSGGRFHNPFKRRHEPPLAWWSGIRDVDKEGLSLSIPLPDYYSGKVRIMAVGLSANNVGHTETTSTVRGPLTLTPQLPLMAAPGDTFEASLILRNTGDSPLQLKLGLELPQNLTAAAPLPATLQLAPQAEAVAPLRLTAGQEPGEAKLTFTASDASGQVFTRRASLSLRPALPLSHSLAAGNTQNVGTTQTAGARPATGKNSKKAATQATQHGAAETKKKQGPFVLPLHRNLYAYGAEVSLTVSPLPLPALRGLLRYLENYPYACVEQSISRALPLALLHTRPTLDSVLRPGKKGGNSDQERAERKAEAQKTLEKASSALQSALTNNGLSLWGQARSENSEDANEGDLLLTAYGADYALALREAGMPLPDYLTQRLLDAVENGSNNEARTLNEARAQAYALWVLSRAGVITTQRLEMLTRALDGLSSDGKKLWRKDVTAALMAGSYAALRMDRHAQALLAGVQLDAAEKALAMENGLMDSTAARGLMVAVLARHFPQKLANAAPALALELTVQLNAPRGATFAAAQGARALLLLSSTMQAAEKDARADKALEAIALSCAQRQSWSQEAPGTSPRRAEGMLSLDDPGCAAFSLDTAGMALPLFWELSSAGYDQDLPQKAQAHGLEVTRSISAAGNAMEKDSAGTALQAELGSVLRVELKARADSAEKREVVLMDLLPGGFEMLWQHPDNSNSGLGVLVDRRDDRYIVHTSLGSEEQSFVYHVRVAHRGDFALPPVMAEGLFDRALRANSPAGRVRIE